MKLWRNLIPFFVVTFFFFTGILPTPVQALDFNTILQATPSIVAVENTRRNEADDLLKTEFGQKIDINNSDIRDFRDLRGFYPKLASIIIQNAPYEKVEDVLNIPGLTESQKERLQANLDNFTANPQSSVFNEGDERYNAGVY